MMKMAIKNGSNDWRNHDQQRDIGDIYEMVEA